VSLWSLAAANAPNVISLVGDGLRRAARLRGRSIVAFAGIELLERWRRYSRWLSAKSRH